MPLQQTSGNVTADAYGGGVAAVPNYIEDVFSTYLYTGNGNATSRTIQNNIDLSTYGGMVWIKSRSGAYDNDVTDTARGARNPLFTNRNYAQNNNVDYAVNSFLTNGFTLASTDNLVNRNNTTYASWSFRKQPKFFDVVTWTGDGTDPRNISHSLGSAPGCVIIKCTSNATNWSVYHIYDGSGIVLNLNSTAVTGTTTGGYCNQASSTTFTVNASGSGTSGIQNVNASGYTYVAYLFAHNAGGFGVSGSDNVISCGSFTTDSGGNYTANLGYEPQWILTKRVDSTSDWQILDNMRGTSYASSNYLYPNTSGAEAVAGTGGFPNLLFTATGFQVQYNFSTNATWIYIAIRRGPMKTPTTGTSVYSGITRTGNGTANTVSVSGFSPDLAIAFNRLAAGNGSQLFDRLRGGTARLQTSNTGAEVNITPQGMLLDFSNAYRVNSSSSELNKSGDSYVDWLFGRAPSFFDEVCYTGTGTTWTVNHNLTVPPELIIIKDRTDALDWTVYSATTGNAQEMVLNSNTGAYASTKWGSTSPTSSVFTLATTAYETNGIGSNYVAYLFATCAGVSKVSSYTGTGATQTISCGFTGGARWVLIKRTDSTGDWYVWDTARGMVSGTDPSLKLNTTAAEVNANSIYTTTGGFQIVSTAAGINASGGSYLFFAVA